MTDNQKRLRQLERQAKKNTKKEKIQKMKIHYLKAQKKSIIRGSFKPSNRQNCLVCGKYIEITAAHHIIPLKNQKDFDTIDHDYVWLCPTHHKLVHLAIDEKEFSETIEMKNKIIEICKGECYDEIIKHD